MRAFIICTKRSHTIAPNNMDLVKIKINTKYQ